MQDLEAETPVDRTAVAAVVAIILILPALLLGGYAVDLYHFIANTHWLGMWGASLAASPWQPVIYAVSGFVIPEALRAIVGSVLAILAATLMFYVARPRTVALTVLSIWLLAALGFAAYHLVAVGPRLPQIAILGSVLGVLLGCWPFLRQP
jgi:hypothetical protein